jgi:hypothetical protein
MLLRVRFRETLAMTPTRPTYSLAHGAAGFRVSGSNYGVR